jgi:integrase
LYRGADHRWRIIATGERFREPDERRAVQKFRDWQAKNSPDSTVKLLNMANQPPPNQSSAQFAGHDMPLPASSEFLSDSPVRDLPKWVYEMPSAVLWGWLREQLITRPEYIAKMTGILEVAGLRNLPLPRPPIKLADLVRLYVEQNPAKEKSKREALSVWNAFTQFASAKTLDDLTQETLLQYRQHIEQSGKSGGTKAAYYGRIKNIIAFGLKCGLDTQQITAALARCKVLWTADKPSAPDPQPISREDFSKLLTAGNGKWRAILLTAANCCMHLDEVCSIKWTEIDLAKKTYAAIRGKTADQRIPRAAVLWNETAEALKALPRRGEYVFTSTHGTRYNRNSLGNDFAELRVKAGVPDTVKFDHIRDGSYTAACQGTTDERQARVLAGHKAEGLQDRYVLRNPEITAVACQAVYKAYGPF